MRAPRSVHAEWEPGADRPDPIAVLEAQARTRLPELVPIRYGRMLSSPFAFFRGGAGIMAADLATTPRTGIRVQLAGDAHVANFGGFGSPERELLFDVNDFDETLPGPWDWDVKRLVASIAIVGRERGFGAKERRTIVRSTVAQYREAMRAFASTTNLAVFYARLDGTELLARARQEARHRDVRRFEHSIEKATMRDSVRAFDRLTHVVDGERRIVSDPPLIVPAEELMPEGERRELVDRIRRACGRHSEGLGRRSRDDSARPIPPPSVDVPRAVCTNMAPISPCPSARARPCKHPSSRRRRNRRSEARADEGGTHHPNRMTSG
jgi:uncharacterized protein (DUF2252 family)